MVVGALLPPIMTKQEWKERENVKGVLDYLTQNQYFIFNIIIIVNICKSWQTSYETTYQSPTDTFFDILQWLDTKKCLIII